MTENQKSAILKKIGRPEAWSISNPTELKPFLMSIYNGLDRFNTADASQLMDAIFTIHACDRNRQPYSENWVKENEDSYTLLKSLLQKNMIPQTCELCNVGEDAMKFDSRRVCQDCINKL